MDTTSKKSSHRPLTKKEKKELKRENEFKKKEEQYQENLEYVYNILRNLFIFLENGDVRYLDTFIDDIDDNYYSLFRIYISDDFREFVEENYREVDDMDDNEFKEYLVEKFPVLFKGYMINLQQKEEEERKELLQEFIIDYDVFLNIHNNKEE
jgi:hypothetical protein